MRCVARVSCLVNLMRASTSAYPAMGSMAISRICPSILALLMMAEVLRSLTYSTDI